MRETPKPLNRALVVLQVHLCNSRGIDTTQVPGVVLLGRIEVGCGPEHAVSITSTEQPLDRAKAVLLIGGNGLR